MSCKLTFYIPESLKNTDDVKNNWERLKKLESLNDIKVAKEIMNDEKEWELKSQTLWFLAVYKRIKINQTRRTKSLYPQLVVSIDNKPFTFYPQSYGKDEITIEEFLEGLFQKTVRCLHDKKEIIANIKYSSGKKNKETP